MDLNIAYSNIERINSILIFENINNDIVHMNNLLYKKFNKKIVLKNNFIKHNENNFDYKKYSKIDMEIINKNLDLIKNLEVYNYIIQMSIEKRFKL